MDRWVDSERMDRWVDSERMDRWVDSERIEGRTDGGMGGRMDDPLYCGLLAERLLTVSVC